MIRKTALERWETKMASCEASPQAIWPIAKSLKKGNGLKAPSAIHGPVDPILYTIDKADIIADCLETQFMPHDFFDYDHKRRVKS
jgi:hypothetical protein